jgi:protocatechuate 3,4-dioxygenase beta subunit
MMNIRMIPGARAALLASALMWGALPEAWAGIHGSHVPHCRVSPASSSFSSYPGADKITPSSNLALPAGKSIPAPGQLLFLHGRLYDRNCVPLKGAMIEMWHAAPDGRVIYPPKGAFFNPYPLFAGAGRAISDNEGKFAFTSVFPGPYTIVYKRIERTRAPHATLRITHPSFAKPYAMEMYFEGDSRNLEDPYFLNYSEEGRSLIEATVAPEREEDINAGLRVYYDITLPETDPFRRF